jgi:hypothetical protein
VLWLLFLGGCGAPVVAQPAAPSTLGFFTLTPCRVVDTRNPVGPWGGPAMSANVSRSFTMTGRCGIPTSADAVSIIVTAVLPTAAGGLRVYPSGTSLPGTTSLMYKASMTRANNGGFGLGSGGALAVHVDQPAGSTVHLVMDVTGYYETGAATPPPPPSGSGPHLWSSDFGGTGGLDSAFPLGAAVDGGGQIAIAGYIQGTVNLGTGSLSSAGLGDVFIAKYDSQGAPLWSRRAGAGQDDRAKAVAVDSSGNVLVTGLFYGTVDFGGGAVSSAPNAANCFVAKYTAAGAHLWSKRLSSASGIDEGMAIAADSAGNVLVTGMLYQTSNFGGANLTSAGSADVFLVKLSPTGAHLWSKRVGGTAEEFVFGLAVDVNGNPAITGHSTGSADFGGGTLAGAGAKDIFVAQYSGSNGAHSWSRRVGGSSDDVGRGIAIDGAGDVVVTGNFVSASVNFGSGAIGNSGGADIFLAKYASDGTARWSKRFGGSLSLDEKAFGVDVDSGGNILVTGSVVDAIDFGGGSLPGDGYYDIFIAKFGSAGGHAWSKRTGAGAGTAIAAEDSTGNVVATGYFAGTTVVNFGGSNLSSPGGYDMFLVEFGP